MDPIEIKRLTPEDAQVLLPDPAEVFDERVNPALAAEFLADPRHHLLAAIANGQVVGFVSAVHYVHPDKPAELWINEVGVSEPYRGHGLAKRLMHAMFDHGRTLGCGEAWVLTEKENIPARRLYTSVGGADSEVVYFTFPLS
jgi:ribosomal protein S18 acetylase RimI-like enzyme